MRPQQATAADFRETKLDGNKHIYVCVMPYPRITSSPPWFSVFSISVKCLVPNSFVAAEDPAHPCPEDFSGTTQHRRVLFLENQDLNGDVLFDRGFTCVNGKLYAVGGWMLETSLGQSAFTRNWESKAMCIDFSTLLPNVTYSHLNPMNCGKPFPVLAGIGNLIFVLPGPPFHFGNLSHPCFEAYDPSEDSWSPLVPPPFLDSSDLEIERSSDYKCFGIRDKLYVSTDYVSYAFDMEEMRWEACQLFRGFRHPDHFEQVCDWNVWMSLSLLCEEEEGNWGDAAEDGGPPFAFILKAILYGEDDVLICVLRSWKPLVVAYQIASGRVVNAQLLCLLEEHALVDNLIDLGRGFICCQFRKRLYSPVEGPLSLSFMVFWVSKLGGDGAVADGGSDGKFLQFKQVHQSTQEIEVKGNCHPVYSFSL